MEVLACSKCLAPVLGHCDNKECAWVVCPRCSRITDLETGRYCEGRKPDQFQQFYTDLEKGFQEGTQEG